MALDIQAESVRATTDLTLATGEPAVCVSLRSEARIHRVFVVLYQSLVFLLALATVLLLVSFIYRISQDDAKLADGLQAAGAVVTGVAAGWLEKQRKDARDTLAAVRLAMQNNQCLSEV